LLGGESVGVMPHDKGGSRENLHATPSMGASARRSARKTPEVRFSEAPEYAPSPPGSSGTS
jgi:hypothetical protein